MKKGLSVLLYLLLIPSLVNALDFTVGGIKFYVTSTNNLTVSVMKNSAPYSTYSGDIYIPETVTHEDKIFTVTGINDGVFVDCTGLTGISIPKTIKTIGEQLFNNCQKLKFIKVDDGNEYFCDIDGVMFNNDKTKLLYYPNAKGSEYSTPPSTRIIEAHAFAICFGLTQIEFNEGLQYIKSSAFYYTTGLTSLEFPQSMISIENSAFMRSTALRSIVANNFFSIGENTFPDEVYLNSILYIPFGLKEKFNSSTGWRNFFDIREIENPSNIQDFKFQMRIVASLSNSITIYSDIPCEVGIYLISGQLIKQTIIHSGENYIPLKSGVYIVKCKNTTKKIIVR